MAMTLITTNTLVAGASASTASFTGLDSTYKLYVFKFFDVNPVSDAATLTMNGSDDASGHSYDITKTTSFFRSINNEGDSTAKIQYMTANDLAQGTGVANIVESIGNGADESCAGELRLFNPASTTYVKHFLIRTIENRSDDYAWETFVGGYINTTTAIDEISFKMSSGNFDGTIKMWGVK